MTIKSIENIQSGRKAKYARPEGYEQWKIGACNRLLVNHKGCCQVFTV